MLSLFVAITFVGLIMSFFKWQLKPISFNSHGHSYMSMDKIISLTVDCILLIMDLNHSIVTIYNGYSILFVTTFHEKISDQILL